MSDFTHINGLTLVGKGGVTGDDQQVPVHREAGDDILDHAIA